CLQSKDSPYSF
nr:immunoglobulin light chain junction region [Macaca mulatta]MOW14421.1 immunoglobulin light chain junction region [Macaca mulatta]MOW14645.1 immunoglobulin light chain junction region [Macaca mulatta]MOW14842.1 immunoglobulin light chain junction region [Macaca mulatta]